MVILRLTLTDLVKVDCQQITFPIQDSKNNLSAIHQL